MNKPTLKLFNSLVNGLTILKPYIGELSVDPIPNSFPNGTPDNSSGCAICVILGVDEPTVEEIVELRLLGWVFDYPYVTLYSPNIYQVPTRESLSGLKLEQLLGVA